AGRSRSGRAVAECPASPDCVRPCQFATPGARVAKWQSDPAACPQPLSSKGVRLYRHFATAARVGKVTNGRRRSRGRRPLLRGVFIMPRWWWGPPVVLVLLSGPAPAAGQDRPAPFYALPPDGTWVEYDWTAAGPDGQQQRGTLRF